MSGSSDDEDIDLTPLELREQVVNAELNFLPEKSREKYLKAYTIFNEWKLSKGAKTCSETVLLSYFMEASKTRQASTLWSIFSMLKATIKSKHNVHIETFPKLLAFLKRTSDGYKSKKSRVFTASNIEKFLNEAPDCNFLATKIGLIFGISGACRTNELLTLRSKDVEKHSEKLILVKLLNTKTKIDRSFVIHEEYVKLVEKYTALRPAITKSDRFFLQYRNGKCINQPMGVNKIGAIPREIAIFLKLSEPELYTGHCLRRTSATLLADSGVDLTTLKRHGGWKSNNVAEGYIEDSIENKSKICNNIVGAIRMKQPEDPWSRPSTSKDGNSYKKEESCHVETEETEGFSSTQILKTTTVTVPNKTVTLNLTNCNNCTFNF